MNLNKMEVGLWLNYGLCGGIQVDIPSRGAFPKSMLASCGHKFRR